MKRIAFLAPATFAVAASFATGAHAQWSTDPNANLVVADGTNEQVQPKMAATADGGFYISWFDNSTGGYDVRLQRLDAAGNELWPHNGVLVADRDFSSTEDYGLSIDADGNALLAFRFNESGVAQAVVQKVAPDGTPLWGDPGIVLSADSADTHSPKVSATIGDGAFVAWSSSDGSAVIQKVDAGGNPVWAPSGVVFSPPSGGFFVADLHSDADGNAIVSWSAQLSFPDRELWAQKLASADGGMLWGDDPVKIFDGTEGAMQLGNFPPFIEDGAGGAVFVWYTVTTQGSVRVQHVDATGTQLFPQNGVLASIDDTQAHYEPDGAYDPESGDIYALWRETDVLTQQQIGVYAQRIDSTGARQWGDGGKVIVPLAPLDQTEMTALPVSGGGMIAAWSSDDYPNPTPLHAARIDADGNYVWPGDIVDFSTEANDSGRLTGVLSTQGYAAYAWIAGFGAHEGDIHAQNINMDGTLGYVDTDTIFRNGFDPKD
jgi:hypothetical protein